MHVAPRSRPCTARVGHPNHDHACVYAYAHAKRLTPTGGGLCPARSHDASPATHRSPTLPGGGRARCARPGSGRAASPSAPTGSANAPSRGSARRCPRPVPWRPKKPRRRQRVAQGQRAVPKSVGQKTSLPQRHRVAPKGRPRCLWPRHRLYVRRAAFALHPGAAAVCPLCAGTRARHRACMHASMRACTCGYNFPHAEFKTNQ